MAGEPILVLAATGGQGGAVTDALLALDAPVRALVRDPGQGPTRRLAGRGAEVVAGSLDDRASLAAAMAGVAGVFALTTPFEAGVDAELRQGVRSWPPPAIPVCPIWCSARWQALTSTAACRISTAKHASRQS